MNDDKTGQSLPFERRAAKIGNHVRTWDTASMAEQNRSLILALADRLDRLEGK
jgi:hypothetical protein